METAKNKARALLVAEIDEAEVACIIAESCCGMLRPKGQTAVQAMEEIKGHSEQAHNDFTKAARRVMIYIQNQLQNAKATS